MYLNNERIHFIFKIKITSHFKLNSYIILRENSIIVCIIGLLNVYYNLNNEKFNNYLKNKIFINKSIFIMETGI